MGCGCGGRRGGGQRNVARPGQRAIVTPQAASTNRGIAATPSPIQLQALARQQTQSLNQNKLTSQRRQVEAKRRQAIARRLLGH